MIDLLHRLCVCVTPSSVNAKKKDLLIKHGEMLDEILQAPKKQIEETMLLQRVVQNLPDKDSTTWSCNYRQPDAVVRTDLQLLKLPSGCGFTVKIQSPPELQLPLTKGIYTSPVAHASSSYTVTSSVKKITPILSGTCLKEAPLEPSRSYAQATTRQTKDNAMKRLSEMHSLVPVEIIGDNIDGGMRSTRQSLVNKKKDWHWFVMLVAQKRIYNLSLPNMVPQADILTIDSSTFLPSNKDLESYSHDVDFHIMHTLVKFMPFLEDFKALIPDFIPHTFIEETSRKTEFLDIELIEESENSSDGIVKIMQRIHEIAVPAYQSSDGKRIIERVVLGGDVLTCERAYSAQEALANAETDFAQLQGVIHRPEGFHRVMNLVKVQQCS